MTRQPRRQLHRGSQEAWSLHRPGTRRWRHRVGRRPHL